MSFFFCCLVTGLFLTTVNRCLNGSNNLSSDHLDRVSFEGTTETIFRCRYIGTFEIQTTMTRIFYQSKTKGASKFKSIDQSMLRQTQHYKIQKWEMKIKFEILTMYRMIRWSSGLYFIGFDMMT